MRTQSLWALVISLVGAASVAPAQTVTLDEGSFRISVGGREVGTEVFSVRQNGSGENAVIIAVGRVVLDSEKGPQELSSELQVAGGFSAQIVSPAGEMMREYLAGDGAVVVDEGVAHQYYFLARRADGKSAGMPVIIPRLSRQVVAQVAFGGADKIAIAGRSYDALKYTVTAPGTPGREVWTDSEGRVLRLEIADRKFIAQRVAAPK